MLIEFNIFTSDINNFYNDLVKTGITSKGNIMYDILHPYYFQDPKIDCYNNSSDCADGFYYNLLLPQIAKLGAANCWQEKCSSGQETAEAGMATSTLITLNKKSLKKI